MTRRTARRLAAVGIALCVVALALGVTERVVWPPGLTEANARRIRKGMTLREVERIFGVPCDFPEGKQAGVPGNLGVFWLGAKRAVVLDLGGEDRVRDVVLITKGEPWEPLPDPPPELFPLARLRALLGW